MSGITDIGSRLSQQYFLSMLQDQLNETQRQSSSGKKSDTIAGLGTLGASQAISYRTQSKLLDSYTANLNVAKGRFEITDKAIGSVTDSARDILTNLRSLLQDSNPQATITASNAQASLNVVVQKLNTQLDGRYLFAGDDISHAPVNNAAQLNTTATNLVNTAMAGPPLTAANVVTAARAAGGTALGYSGTVATAGNVSFRAGDNTDIDYTQKANQSGYADILRGLSIVSNLKQPTTAAEQSNYWALVNGAIDLLDQGSKAVDNYQGVMGNQAKIVGDLVTQHSETQASFDQFVGGVEDVDMVEAATKLQALKTQTETSYSLIASLRDLSLIKYL